MTLNNINQCAGFVMKSNATVVQWANALVPGIAAATEWAVRKYDLHCLLSEKKLYRFKV